MKNYTKYINESINNNVLEVMFDNLDKLEIKFDLIKLNSICYFYTNFDDPKFLSNKLIFINSRNKLGTNIISINTSLFYQPFNEYNILRNMIIEYFKFKNITSQNILPQFRIYVENIFKN